MTPSFALISYRIRKFAVSQNLAQNLSFLKISKFAVEKLTKIMIVALFSFNTSWNKNKKIKAIKKYAKEFNVLLSFLLQRKLNRRIWFLSNDFQKIY